MRREHWLSAFAVLFVVSSSNGAKAQSVDTWPTSDYGPVWLAEDDGSINNVEAGPQLLRISRCWPSEVGLFVCSSLETGRSDRSAIIIRSGLVLDVNQALAGRNDYSCKVDWSPQEEVGPRTIIEHILGAGLTNKITVGEFDDRWPQEYVRSTIQGNREANGFYFHCVEIAKTVATEGVAAFLDPYFVGKRTVFPR